MDKNFFVKRNKKMESDMRKTLKRTIQKQTVHFVYTVVHSVLFVCCEDLCFHFQGKIKPHRKKNNTQTKKNNNKKGRNGKNMGLCISKTFKK